ncbi:MAG: glycosyltransferase [Clostridia bacterium]|nr:glycosyltransferase [Clostridia bacterium]
MERPFFSVITVCYNAGEALKSTVTQLAEQTCKDYEHIIKDGGSTDGSVDAIGQIASLDQRIKLTVSRDGGIYDAMNQAIALAKGRFVFFLNCGDRFKDVAILEKIKEILSERHTDPSIDEDAIVYGSCILRGEKLLQPNRITPFYLYRRPLVHQTMFFGMGVFRRHGNFDTSMKIRADHDLTLRAFNAGTEFSYTDLCICVYEGDGYSEKPENRQLRVEELQRIRDAHFTPAQRRKYRLFLALGMRRLRNRIASKRSPAWMRRIYMRVSNLFNK